MILIADSGSTKTEWVLLNGKQIIAELYTQGINPYFQSGVQIAAIVNDELLPQLPFVNAPLVTHIYYYGAGCSSSEKCEMIEQALAPFFIHAVKEINHDLLAAARAACGNEKGLAAILGTGSNSCLFDGQHIVSNQPSLGFILGDEGSGGYIGKELLKQFLYHELPADLHQLFNNQYQLTKEMVLEHIYKNSMPNRYAASFVPFVAQYIQHPYLQQLVCTSFDEFFKRHITSYTNYSSYSLSAVGSVAYVFQQQVKIVAAQYQIAIKHIFQKPMEGLIHYHTHSL